MLVPRFVLFSILAPPSTSYQDDWGKNLIINITSRFSVHNAMHISCAHNVISCSAQIIVFYGRPQH